MTLQVNIPESLALTDFEVLMNLAAKLFERGLVSSGQAAEIVGISKKAFIEIVGKYGVSIFQYDEEELTQELDKL
ncbi:MAG: UPF0175 family protein [Saprospiraceae bacterium]|nr:UPF0175 family protein [Saprospiraceae bacterium]NJL76687.1 UPF0175 family protein [Saprospiraceae bacterium]